MLSEKAIQDRINKHRASLEKLPASERKYLRGRIWEAEAILYMEDDEYFEKQV